MRRRADWLERIGAAPGDVHRRGELRRHGGERPAGTCSASTDASSPPASCSGRPPTDPAVAALVARAPPDGWRLCPSSFDTATTRLLGCGRSPALRPPPKGQAHERPRRSGADPGAIEPPSLAPDVLRAGLLAALGGAAARRPRVAGRRAGRQAGGQPDRQAGGRRGGHRPRALPQDVQGGAAARRAGQGRQAPARAGAHRPGPARRQAAPRDRQVRRDVAARLHRALRHVERPSRGPERQAPLLGLHGHQARAQHRPRPGRSAPTARSPPSSCAGDEVERRPALHRRRLRVLVRGRLREQGAGAHAAVRDDHQRQADRGREGRRHHRAVRGARPLLRAAHRARLGVGHRAPRPLRPRRARRLRARPLPEAVPSQVRVEGRPRQEAGRSQVRDLGAALQEPQRRLPQPRPAGGDALEDGVADQHADLGPRAQSRTASGWTPTATSSPTSTASA